MGRLVRACTPICMSYPTLSIKYLFDVDVIQPTDEAFIEKWYPERFWRSYKNGLSLYRGAAEASAAIGTAAVCCGRAEGESARSIERSRRRSISGVLSEGRPAALEIGCGDGAHVPALIAECRIGRYLGIDIDAAGIAVARSLR